MQIKNQTSEKKLYLGSVLTEYGKYETPKFDENKQPNV